MVIGLELTEKTVRGAENLGRDYQIFDTDVHGLSVTIYLSGNRAFTFVYRIAGRQRRMTAQAGCDWVHSAAAANGDASLERGDYECGVQQIDSYMGMSVYRATVR